jgi:hypothetical protein
MIQSKKAKKKIKLSNDVTVYENAETTNKFLIVMSTFNVWKEHSSFVVISSEDHMSINLKSNWVDKIKSNRIYFLESDKRVIVNEIFDNLHVKEKMKWFTNSTSFDYSIFVIYRTIIKNDKLIRKKRVVIDIRKLNAIILTDAYSMSAQTNIIVAVTECLYISVMNVLRYFYQWAVKFEDRHKLTIISHREQEQFNVCVMSYKNSSSYVQRQTDLMLKNLRDFVRAYMNDIVIFSKLLNDHLHHLRQMFERLWHYNVALNSKKTFLKYSLIMLLEQVVDALSLITSKEKLIAIVNLTFSLTLKELKTYLDLIDYMRVYVSWYAQTSLSLQNQKTLLLKDNLIKDRSRKTFAKKTSLHQLIEVEQKSYEHLQATFSKESFLRHFDLIRKLFIDVNISKKRSVERMMFHVKKDSDENVIFKRSNIKFIMFLSKILISTEKRYWSTKLEMTNVIWIVKKIRHLIESTRKSLTIIFIDHSILSEIIKQTSFISFNTDKLNLRLIKASQYLFVLSIEIRVKLEKFHVVFDAFSRLFSIMNKNKFIEENEVLEDLKYDLNALLIHSISEFKTFVFDIFSTHMSKYLDVYFEQEECLMKMTTKYRRFLLNVYDADSQWIKLKQKIQERQDVEDISDDMNFVLRNNQIYYASQSKTAKLCIS